MKSELLIWISSALSFAVALVAAGHAVIYKRDPRSATLWVLLISMLPLAGALLYLLLGINRYRRRALRQSRDDELDLDRPGAGEIPAEIPDALAGLAQLVGRATRLPLTCGNRIEPLVDGAQAYPAMLDAIDGAQHSIALASYIFDRRGIGQTFIDALRRAHKRGVKICVLIDDVYARLSFRSAYHPLRRSGIAVASFNPTLLPARLHAAHLRNHRKILVVDNRQGFTGGMNIYNPYWRPEDLRQACHDLHFRIEGPVVAHLAEAFARDWFDTTGDVLDAAFWGDPPQQSQGSTWQSLARGIEAGPDETIDRMRWTFMGALHSARHTVRIWTPYFVPDQSMLAALSAASLRGVRVELLTPANNDHRTVQWAAQAHFWQVLEHGVRIFERPAPFDHTKLMLVDGQWVCLGSANWDARSLRLNFEFNVEVYDSRLCAELERLYDSIRDQSTEVTRSTLIARPWPTKLRNGFARLLTPVL